MITLRFYNWKLHFVNRYCFCNTELRTAIITEIKGLSIQTQQNTFVLFTLFKLTLDERKTLTKISTCKTSHNHSPKPAHASDTKEQENQQTTKGQKKRRKGRLHLGQSYTFMQQGTAQRQDAYGMSW